MVPQKKFSHKETQIVQCHRRHKSYVNHEAIFSGILYLDNSQNKKEKKAGCDPYAFEVREESFGLQRNFAVLFSHFTNIG